LSAELYNPDPAAVVDNPTDWQQKQRNQRWNSYLLWTGKLLAAGAGTNKAELYTPECRAA